MAYDGRTTSTSAGASMSPWARARSKLVAPLLGATTLGVVLVAKPASPKITGDPLLLEDPRVLATLEDRGLSFQRVVGPDRLARLATFVERDMREVGAGPRRDSPRRPFEPEWLRRGRFELVGVVNRLDRRWLEPDTCGEARLVYRLALDNPGRPTTRLPMTVNVRIPQPRPPGDADCRRVAARWLSRDDPSRLVSELPPPARIEVNFQSVHLPGTRKDMDDSAEYVLRAFELDGRALREDGLFNTPRPDVDKGELLAWVRERLHAIDEGSAVLPDRFLARRIVSVSPRGLARDENRPFSRLLSVEDVAALPLDTLALARTPELLLRRLDELTCTGCHQTRGVAGFHLLGQDRGSATFNALAVGRSPHLTADLAWRKADLESAARGERGRPRPFAAYPSGEVGADCGLVPGLASWTCRPGLVCRDVHGADVGVCARPEAVEPGDPCEDAALAPSTRLEGPIVTARAPDATCPAPVGAQRSGRFCAPNWLGFTGGSCSERCSSVGERRGGAICAPLPAAGYEADCFLSNEPIERCLQRHFVTALVPTCDADHPCRDDYGCARVPNAPPGVGACVPPYFIFQARVDGPRLDR